MTEKDLLLAVLRGQRHHVLAAVEGLGEDEARRAVLPSGWDVRGLLQHLTRDDESFWFAAVVAGEPSAIDRVGAPGWTVEAGRTLAEVVSEYRSASEHTDAVLAAADLEAAPAWWPEFFGSWRLDSVREIVLHLITETACHAGHLDAARELVDGRQHLVLE